MSARRKRRRDRARRHQIPTPRSTSVRRVELYGASRVERLAYTRKQAAEALGVSIATIDRRVVPRISTVKTPWGQRLIPVDELERFLHQHIDSGRPAAPPRPAGRPASLPESIVDRIRLEYARDRSLSDIAEELTAERRADRPRRAAVVAVDGARRARPLTSVAARGQQRGIASSFARQCRSWPSDARGVERGVTGEPH